jgi:hypothetical protein
MIGCAGAWGGERAAEILQPEEKEDGIVRHAGRGELRNDGVGAEKALRVGGARWSYLTCTIKGEVARL